MELSVFTLMLTIFLADVVTKSNAARIVEKEQRTPNSKFLLDGKFSQTQRMKNEDEMDITPFNPSQPENDEPVPPPNILSALQNIFQLPGNVGSGPAQNTPLTQIFANMIPGGGSATSVGLDSPTLLIGAHQTLVIPLKSLLGNGLPSFLGALRKRS